MATNNKPVVWHRDQDLREGVVEGQHSGKYGATFPNVQRGKVSTTGFHHVAIVVKSLKDTIRFYEGALGMKLRAVYPIHGIRGAKHAFLEAGNGNEISFVEFQDPLPSVNPPSFFQVWPIGCVGAELRETTCTTTRLTLAPLKSRRMHHHMAYRCETKEQIYKLREQIKNFGVPISKPVDHDFCLSAYFTDPSG